MDVALIGGARESHTMPDTAIRRSATIHRKCTKRTPRCLGNGSRQQSRTRHLLYIERSDTPRVRWDADAHPPPPSTGIQSAELRPGSDTCSDNGTCGTCTETEPQLRQSVAACPGHNAGQAKTAVKCGRAALHIAVGFDTQSSEA